MPEIESNNCKVIFGKNKCYITYKGKTILERKLNNNLNEVGLTTENKNPNYVNITYNCKNTNCIESSHRRMVLYRNYQTIKTITSKHLVNGIKIDNCKHESVCKNE